MKPYKEQDWYKEATARYIHLHGDVPPPWVYDTQSHPYDLQWRMGAGETFIMVLWGWIEDHIKSEEERIAYIKKYPPPPRWLGWAADFIWDLDSNVTMEEGFDYSPYFEKLKLMGLDGTADYYTDLEDEKWLPDGGD